MLNFMFRFFKELYLTYFTLFFRFACDRWTRPSNLGKGVAGVTAIEAVILMVITAWIEIYIGTKFFFGINRWIIGIAFFALCLPNYYILVTRGHGIGFEREFSHLEKSRKNLLLASCAVIVLAIVAFFIYTVSAYHRFFHIIPKSGF
jgi:hypothetical protein